MRKPVLIGALAIVAVIVGVMGSVTYVLFDLDSVIRTAAIETASKAYKVEVAVERAEMSLKTGDGGLYGVTVPNPPGFSAGNALRMPSIAVSVDTSRPAGHSVSISSIVIDQPRLILEINDGQANLMRLLGSARAYAARSEQEGEPAAKGQPLSVERITVQNGTLEFHADFLGDVVTEVPLPDSRLTQIGSPEEGVPPAQLAAAMAELMLTAAERAVRRIDLAAIAKANNLSPPDIDLGAVLKN